jgi:hypothetical protein
MKKFWGIVLISILLLSCKEENGVTNEEAKKQIAVVPEITAPITKFGFNLNDFTVKYDTIRRGDSFGQLMTAHKVDYPKIARLSLEFKDTFDVRRIRVGKPYTILTSKDTTEAAQIFIYENDKINYTVVDFRDSVSAYTDRKEVN